jgi:hypothetical protein
MFFFIVFYSINFVLDCFVPANDKCFLNLPLPPPKGDISPLSFGEGSGVRSSPSGGGRGRLK